MAGEAFQQWYVQGLQAVHAAAGRARDASAGAGDADAPAEVKGMMSAGADVFAKHADALAGLLQRAGAGPSAMPNPFMDGIQSGSREMIAAAKDPDVRLASVIAAAQIGTHYFIAAYGTLASNAKHLGRAEDAQAIKAMADEMKDGDARFTEFAETVANRRASA